VALHWVTSCLYRFKGPGSNETPEIVLRDPFGRMMARKKSPKKSKHDLPFISPFG
jgi:hypothetical protein